MVSHTFLTGIVVSFSTYHESKITFSKPLTAVVHYLQPVEWRTKSYFSKLQINYSIYTCTLLPFYMLREFDVANGQSADGSECYLSDMYGEDWGKGI